MTDVPGAFPARRRGETLAWEPAYRSWRGGSDVDGTHFQPRTGDFDNLGDTAEGLREILEESFQTVKVDVIGSAALFMATGPGEAG